MQGKDLRQCFFLRPFSMFSSLYVQFLEFYNSRVLFLKLLKHCLPKELEYQNEEREAHLTTGGETMKNIQQVWIAAPTQELDLVMIHS